MFVKKSQIKAVSFSLFADRIIDATIHPAILQSLAIIPPEWELLISPMVSDSQVKLIFTAKGKERVSDQISLTIKSGCIIFSEIITQQQLHMLTVPSIVTAYLRIFSNLGYYSLSISPQSEISFDLATETDQRMRQRLLSNCQQFFRHQNNNPLSLKAAYPYKSGNLFVETTYNSPEFFLDNNHTIYFNGSFLYSLLGNNEAEKMDHLQTLIAQWQIDVNNFSDFIDRYLQTVTNCLPNPR